MTAKFSVLAAAALGFVIGTMSACSMNVRHAPMGQNRWLVTVDGASQHSHGDLMHAANQRALELCGPGGYDILTSDSGTQVSGNMNAEGGGAVHSKGSVSITIECSSLDQGPPGQ